MMQRKFDRKKFERAKRVDQKDLLKEKLVYREVSNIDKNSNDEMHKYHD